MSGRLSARVTQGNNPRAFRHATFGMIHAPRSRAEKLTHLEILEKMPLELVPAMDERRSLRSGHISKRADPIAHIVMKYEHSTETQIIEAMCKACVTKKFETSVWRTMLDTMSGLLPTLSSVDAAIMLKCLMLYEKETCDKEARKHAVELLRCISKSMGNTQVGFYTILYGLQGLNHFSHNIDPKNNKRMFSQFMRALRLGNINFPVLVSIVQSISSRCPQPATAVVEPVLFEAAYRLGAFVEPPELDTLFGLVSSASKFPQSPSFDKILKTAEQFFMGDSDLIAGCSTAQLAGLAHAYSRKGPVTHSGYVEMITRIGNELVRCEDWTPRIIAVVVNSFSTCAVLHQDLVGKLVSVIPNLSDAFDPMQTSMTIYGLSKLGVLNSFPSIIDRANALSDQFSLHSICKLIAVFGDSKIGSEGLTTHLHNRTREQVVWDENALDSVLLVLHALANRPLDPILEPELLRIITDKVNTVTWSKLAAVLLAVAPRQTDSVKELCLAVLCRSDKTELTLPDAIKILHAVSVNVKLTREQVDIVSQMIRERSPAIRELTFKPLNRLATAMIRCGVYDEDLREAVQETLDRYNKR